MSVKRFLVDTNIRPFSSEERGSRPPSFPINENPRNPRVIL
jgi:hypothetical protein